MGYPACLQLVFKKMTLAVIKLKISTLSESLRIGIGLGLGFAVTLTLVVLVMIAGFRQLDKIHENLEQIIQNSNAKIEVSHVMRYAQRDLAVRIYSLALISDKLEKEKELLRFGRSEAEFALAWKKIPSHDTGYAGA